MRKDCGFGKNSLTITGQGISENKKKKSLSEMDDSLFLENEENETEP